MLSSLVHDENLLCQTCKPDRSSTPYDYTTLPGCFSEHSMTDTLGSSSVEGPHSLQRWWIEHCNAWHGRLESTRVDKGSTFRRFVWNGFCMAGIVDTKLSERRHVLYDFRFIPRPWDVSSGIIAVQVFTKSVFRRGL